MEENVTSFNRKYRIPYRLSYTCTCMFSLLTYVYTLSYTLLCCLNKHMDLKVMNLILLLQLYHQTYSSAKKKKKKYRMYPKT